VPWLSFSATEVVLRPPRYSSGAYSVTGVDVTDVTADGKPDIVLSDLCIKQGLLVVQQSWNFGGKRRWRIPPSSFITLLDFLI
jgi:hypothetical protein